MRLNVVGRHANVTEGMREYARRKSSRLDRFKDLIRHGDIVLNMNGGGASSEAEIVLKTDLGQFVATEEAEGMRAAIDLVMDKIERLVSKKKQKVQDKNRQSDRLKAMSILDEGMRKAEGTEEEILEDEIQAYEERDET